VNICKAHLVINHLFYALFGAPLCLRLVFSLNCVVLIPSDIAWEGSSMVYVMGYMYAIRLVAKN